MYTLPWVALSATGTLFIWHSITCCNVPWIECWDETPFLWCYIKIDNAPLIYASWRTLTADVLVYWRFRWSIPLFQNQNHDSFIVIVPFHAQRNLKRATHVRQCNSQRKNTTGQAKKKTDTRTKTIKGVGERSSEPLRPYAPPFCWILFLDLPSYF